MNFQNPSYTPAAANQRIRTLWQKFEQSQAKDRAQLDITIKAALEKAEAEWNNNNNNTRTISRIQRNATKAQIAKKIKALYFEEARAKWHGKLEPFALKPDFWTDLTEDEKRRITNTLGAEDESDEDAVVSELPPPPPPPSIIVQKPPSQPSSHFFQPLAPSFSTSSRATNLSSSSYAFVNPSEFNSEEEDDFEFEIPSSNPVVTSVDLTSEDDDEPAASIPNYPSGARPSLVIGSAFSRASLSSASNPTPPSSRPLVSGFAYNAATNGAAIPKRPQPPPQPQVPQNEIKSTQTKAAIPRQPYVGPSLHAPDEPIDEELEFEKFKMKTRMEKIVEFHEAAALAEISLSIEMYKARKQLKNNNNSSSSKEEDAPRVLDHQKRMLQLQKEKEEERKAIVKSERARRQSELARRRSTSSENVPTSNGAFKTTSSFQEGINLPSRFNLDTLLSEDPAAKQQTNVESLLNGMFADDCGAAPSHFNNTSSTSPNLDTFYSSSSIQQEQLRQIHSSTSWSNTPSSSNSSPKHHHLSPFGESSDEEDHGAVNAPTPATTTSAWSSKDVTTPISSAWSSSSNKKTTASVTQPLQSTSVVSNPNPSFAMEVIEPELTATPPMNSKAAKGKKPLVSASEKSPVLPSTVETATASSKAPVTETTVPPPIPTPPLAPAPVGKKQTKKQRQAANKKGGASAAAAPATVAATPIPEQEPETEPVLLPQRESPKLETPVAAIPQASEHTPSSSWLPTNKMVPGMARARMDDSTPSFSWEDEISSTPRPASKIPAHHIQQTLAKKSEGTLRPPNTSMLKKKGLMADIFSGAASSSSSSSSSSLEQTLPAPVVKGQPVWGSTSAASPGPSLWGKTKADFETAKVQPTWVPGGVDDYKYGGDGGGGGNEGASLWESSMSSHSSKQNGKAAAAASIPVKQQQPSIAAQRLRRVSEAAAASPAPSNSRAFGSTKNLSDTPPPPPPSINSNSKKTQGKKNGKGKQRATIEVVSDEEEEKEKDNIDILPPDSTFIMEPIIIKKKEIVILEPKPSVPPFVYNPIIDFAGGDNNDDVFEYLSSTSTSSSTRPTASSSSSSQQQQQDDFLFGSESRIFSSSSSNNNTFKTTSSMGGGGSGGVPDWSAMGGGKHARWTPAVVTK